MKQSINRYPELATHEIHSTLPQIDKSMISHAYRVLLMALFGIPAALALRDVV